MVNTEQKILDYLKKADCPNCNDRKKCTADSYDAKKCINVQMNECIQ